MRLKKGQHVLFDTNIAMDLATQRSGWKDSFIAYDVAVVLGLVPMLSVSGTTDIAYLLASSKYRLTEFETKQALQNLFVLFDLMDVRPSDAHEAMQSELSDYEDALLCFAASRNDCKAIITWNIKDFVGSPVRALTPAEFVKAYKPKNYIYDLVNV